MSEAAERAATTKDEVVVAVTGLAKTFHIGFFRKRVEAVRGIDFEVRRGEIFGLLGPNGAGKTTSIKMLLRLIFPSAGDIRIFGASPDRRETMQRVGYMPENPYVYQYLRPLEFLDLCGRLVGMAGKERRDRAEKLVDRLGLRHAVDRPIGKFSKGMTQRIGLAQALLHDPEVLVLDEPFSGLDPIGRKEIRDVLLEQRNRGKTLLFTSHILSDVEMLCDRVTILRQGKVVATGSIDALLRPDVRRIDVELASAPAPLRRELQALGATLSEDPKQVVATVEGDERVGPVLEACVAAQVHVVSVTPRRETLEDLFVRNAMEPHGDPQASQPPR